MTSHHVETAYERGWARLKWRMKTMQAEDHIRLPPVEQRARIDWPGRAFVLSYWNEEGAEKELLIEGLMGSFIIGFLGTAGPRLLDASPLLAAETVPPCNCTMAWTKCRPMPSPPWDPFLA